MFAIYVIKCNMQWISNYDLLQCNVTSPLLFLQIHIPYILLSLDKLDKQDKETVVDQLVGLKYRPYSVHEITIDYTSLIRHYPAHVLWKKEQWNANYGLTYCLNVWLLMNDKNI